MHFLTFCHVSDAQYPVYQSFVRREVSILTSSIDVTSRGSNGKNAAAILTDRRQLSKTKTNADASAHKHLIFKVIKKNNCTPPWCRSTLAGLPDGVGEGAQASPDMGEVWVTAQRLKA